MITTSCKKDKEEITEGESILPTSFKVDIPSSISNDQSNKSIQADTLKGNEIYEHLRTFIAIGEGAADIVQSIMQAISVYNINRAMSLSFQGDDDGRTKNLTVVENSSYDGINWEFQMTITDADSESNADGGNGMQIFWNTSPVKGIALLKPYNINRNDTELDQAVFRIDYSEAGEYGYDKHMFVSIIDIPMPDPSIDPFGMNNLKMFAGKTGDIVDIYGNSNHPNAFFYTTNTGFNWAFVASGNEAQDIAVAELGLPPHTLDASDRATLLETYSIKTVLTDEINQHFINTYGFLPDSASLADYLGDADAPGYFNTNGFSQSGSAPSGDYSPLNDNIQSMAPFNPSTVNNLTIEFKN
ncbi:MAG: hypothetical protein C0594_07015 [Marinilabiliales bacterium]|nr:MAG: hypothetical protein C0594_07015 [Marinilabiliales bacterium]